MSGPPPQQQLPQFQSPGFDPNQGHPPQQQFPPQLGGGTLRDPLPNQFGPNGGLQNFQPPQGFPLSPQGQPGFQAQSPLGQQPQLLSTNPQTQFAGQAPQNFGPNQQQPLHQGTPPWLQGQSLGANPQMPASQQFPGMGQPQQGFVLLVVLASRALRSYG